MKTFLSALIAITFGTLTYAQEPAPMPRAGMVGPSESITVMGTGRASVAPDRYSFTVGVQTVSATVDDAVNENNGRTSAVIAALKRAGVADTDIRTSNFSIYPQQDYGQNPNGEPRLPLILGYQVSNQVTVRRDKVSDVGKLLQAALNAGVNSSSGLQFEVSDPARGRDQALRAAYDDARAKAALLAQAAGRMLGRALRITEGGAEQIAPPPTPMPMAMRAQAVVSQVPVESGTQDVTYSVSVVFELR